jgi:hypothetical protein
MARITQTFQTIIEGGIAKTLGESTFLVTTSNTLKMDQPWQRRFKNRLFVGPPNEAKLKKFIEDAWNRIKNVFLDNSDIVKTF